MPKAPDLKDRKHLAGKHYEPLRKHLESLLYPVDENGNRLVDENNEPLKAFPDGHMGCRYERGYSDNYAAEDMKKLNPEEYGYIKYTMVKAVRKENFGDIIHLSKPKPEPVTTEPEQETLSHEHHALAQVVVDHTDKIDRHASAINDHAKRISDHRTRLGEHAKSIDALMQGGLKHLSQITNLETRVTALEKLVMDMGKENAELASSFRSLQDKLKPVTTSQDVSAIALNKALGH
jgi:hypothetical protein